MKKVNTTPIMSVLKVYSTESSGEFTKNLNKKQRIKQKTLDETANLKNFINLNYNKY
tara:strand:+ start:104 stop:274 length:171 start_codon:yes stop_codon:yes gene_type:complete